MDILRIVAWSEGISFLLFGISMPLKYGYDMPEPNYVIGMAHGVLFILFNFLVLASSMINLSSFAGTSDIFKKFFICKFYILFLRLSPLDQFPFF